MPSYMQNYGFAKTVINKNNKKTKNEIMWNGDYNGNIANIEVNINDNGNEKIVKMQLDNNDILHMLGVQPINIPLEQRLQTDFLDGPHSLENVMSKGILSHRKYLKNTKKAKAKAKIRHISHKKTSKNRR